MNLRHQKKIASELLGVGKKRVKLDSTKLSEIKEAITKSDLRSLIASKIIQTKPLKGHSRGRANKIRKQKSKGKRKGPGSRKGRRTARLSRKKSWMTRVRTQRRFIKNLKEKNLLTRKDYRGIYLRIKNNRFRSIKLIKIYLKENNLIKEK